ncbi:ABC transporter family substrate-binding protein [Natronoglycomyces albus]|uniref:ABC transporter family substrate-binding protein n=1 Tax=Natronoglycomyces albus TaxID=2811108 RepID=A0A895XNR2_9ACTN|nr:ABC transporter family substrate-binding protein [Natronoglycomyces albus]QSB04705.1 ABC transporter family substrate-binding protein [Natronoglycomyces albus]
MKKSVFGLVSATSLALVLTACGGGSATPAGAGFEDCEDNPVTCNEGERRDGGEINWAIDSGWEGWSLVSTESSSVYTRQAILATLPSVGEFNQAGDFVYNDGLLAEEPQMLSDDPLQVEYTLNPEATWGDGTNVNVDDFIWNWYARSGDQDLCEGCVPPATSYGANVDSIDEGDNEQTIIVTYRDGFLTPEWMMQEVLSHPAHIAEAEGFDWQNDASAMEESVNHFVSTVPTWTAGPYKITDAAVSDYVILEPNQEWAGSIQPTLDKITLQRIESVESIITELRNGSIDGASPSAVDPDMLEQLQGTQGINYRVSAGPAWNHIDMNMNNEFLSDDALREAIFTAIDVEAMLDRGHRLVMEDLERKLSHIFRNDNDYFEDYLSDTAQGTGDLEAARSILEEAGYSFDNNDALLSPDGEPVELEFRFGGDNSINVTYGELLQQQLGDLGINIQLNQIATGELGDVLSGQNYDMVYFGWTGSPTFAQNAHQYWHSQSGSNYGGLDDEVLDSLAEEVMETTDMDQAAQLANAALEQAVTNHYVLPITDTPVIIMANDELVNVRDNWATQSRAMYNMAEWGLAAQ